MAQKVEPYESSGNIPSDYSPNELELLKTSKNFPIISKFQQPFILNSYSNFDILVASGPYVMPLCYILLLLAQRSPSTTKFIA